MQTPNNNTQPNSREMQKRFSEEKFQSLFETIPSGVAIYEAVEDGKDFIFHEFNSAAEKIDGISRKDVVGRRVCEVFPGVKDFGLFAILQRVYKTGKPEYFSEAPYSDQRIKIGWRENWVYKLPSNEIVAVYNDITERKKAEEALRVAEEKHRTMLDSANVMVQSVDAEGRYLFVNEEWKKVLGYTDLDLKEINIGNVVHKNHLNYCMDVFKKVMGGLSIHGVETVFVTKDGSELVVRGNACPIFKDGRFVSTVAFFEDITERKKTERDLTLALEALSANLDKTELMNEKLRVVGSLTRHDVRNKLSAVTGYSYILKKKHFDLVDVVEGLDKMSSAVVESMRIFDFAKAYEQIGVEELVDVDVAKGVDEALEMFSGLTFKVVNECEGLTVRADSLLRQLIYNFIDNTRKYGQKTSIAKVYYETVPSGGFRLIYEDDGVGIPKGNKGQLFKQGFSTGGSTGFGLFLSKKMIEVYGWNVTEEGIPGEGAKFVITILSSGFHGISGK